MADAMTYANFKLRTFEIVNDVRKGCDLPLYTQKKFDEGWQYRVVGHENYRVAYDEMINLIYGWW